eukprot:COSAG02_NODE_639_length_19078_cov_9.380262_12_plen_177_part_00
MCSLDHHHCVTCIRIGISKRNERFLLRRSLWTFKDTRPAIDRPHWRPENHAQHGGSLAAVEPRCQLASVWVFGTVRVAVDRTHWQRCQQQQQGQEDEAQQRPRCHLYTYISVYCTRRASRCDKLTGARRTRRYDTTAATRTRRAAARARARRPAVCTILVSVPDLEAPRSAVHLSV